MKLTGLKKTVALISLLLLITILIYTQYQDIHPKPLNQHNYKTKNITEIHVGSTTLKHFFTVKGHYLANNNSNLYRDELSSHLSPSFKKPLRLPAPLPSLNELHVMPVPEHDCDQPHILMNDNGRLGNKICQYAVLYLLRHYFGVRVSITRVMSNSLGKIFKNIDLPIHDGSCFTKRMKFIKYDNLFKKLYTAASRASVNTRNKNFITEPLLNGSSYYVYDYPHPRKLIFAHRDLFRSLFKLRYSVVRNAIQNIDKALKPFNATYYKRNFNIVTVHVRRTDFTGFIRKAFNMTQVDKLYFTRAFQFFKKRLTKPVFLVLSDDPKWCSRNLKAKDVTIIASKNTTVDLAAMTLGDHHVTSYGTYSFIGALLGPGHITHPIGQDREYNVTAGVVSPYWHYISKDETYIIDNSNVVL